LASLDSLGSKGDEPPHDYRSELSNLLGAPWPPACPLEHRSSWLAPNGPGWGGVSLSWG
jgi:hypothetical protein